MKSGPGTKKGGPRQTNLPYLALYDKKGQLITTFEGTQKADTILDAFEKGRQ